jgi:hypothetical protein
LAIGLVAALCLFGCSGVRPKLDQDNLYGTCCTIEVSAPDLFVQTVTAGMSGRLTGILVEIHDPVGSGLMRFSLYGIGSVGADEAVYTAEIDTAMIFDGSVGGVEYLWDVEPAGLDVRVGDEFAFGLTGIEIGDGAEIANDLDAQYEGGELMINGVPSEEPQDLAFRTYVATSNP